MKNKKDMYTTKYLDLLSKAFYDKDEESIRNLIDRVYTDGFEDGATEKNTAGKIIEIEVYNGCVTDVKNLPDEYEYKIIDHDIQEDTYV
jgi:predicted lipid-binding transport protein (Tim44 family)